jgi:hypothetical protein
VAGSGSRGMEQLYGYRGVAAGIQPKLQLPNSCRGKAIMRFRWGNPNCPSDFAMSLAAGRSVVFEDDQQPVTRGIGTCANFSRL